MTKVETLKAHFRKINKMALGKFDPTKEVKFWNSKLLERVIPSWAERGYKAKVERSRGATRYKEGAGE